VLAGQLAEVHATSLADVFLPEQIIVQNAGMAHWLSLRIAEQLGIAANLKFLFPAEFMWQLIRTVLEGLPDVEPFRPGVLRWRILRVLTNHAGDFPELATYLKDSNQLRVYQLACRLEEMLDRCLFYRPEWITDWEAGDTPHWQSRLWQKLSEDGDAVHWVALQQQFLQALATEGKALVDQRVLFFGLAQLSPGYLRLLREVAGLIDVHIFLLNPCQQYWGDIVSETVKLRSEVIISDYLEIGHPLLATMGRQGRDFFDQLISLEPDSETLCFEDNPGSSMLAVLQNDILNLTNRVETGPVSILADSSRVDASISLHSCHTPMREIEVLYDQLLDLFNHDPDLTPEDVIVMMPSVKTYAAYIDAVFTSPKHPIPYVIADRILAENNIIADILSALLDIPDSRYEINRIIALLDYQPVRERFNLQEDDVLCIRDWCAQTNIRWGIDARMRQALDLPETSEHTWLAGLRRMLLGSIMHSDSMYQDILPFTDIEGGLAVTLGYFVDFAERLFELREWSNKQQSLGAWVIQIQRLMNCFIHADNLDSDCLRDIEVQLHNLSQHAEHAEYSENIDFQLIKQLILESISQRSQHQRFTGSGLVFCELTPMRSIPFDVVCLIGMSDAQYPKPVTRYSFDLLADHGYRRGDRSPRSEERYLFLESLLAARKKFYISYVGRDVRKNTVIPPSVLVSELLDCIEQTFAIERKQLITEHPLQAFSTRYYDANSDLFTYSDYPVDRQPSQSVCAFVNTQLNQQPITELSLRELIRFIRFPVAYFLVKRLGIRFDYADSELPECEPFILEKFDAISLRQSIYQAYAHVSDEIVKRLRAQSLLPHGTQGQRLFEQELAVVNDLVERSSAITTKTVTIEKRIDGILLSGTVKVSPNRALCSLVSENCIVRIFSNIGSIILR